MLRSLVGSEMCIRDRHITAGAPLGAVGRKRVLGPSSTNVVPATSRVAATAPMPPPRPRITSASSGKASLCTCSNFREFGRTHFGLQLCNRGPPKAPFWESFGGPSPKSTFCRVALYFCPRQASFLATFGTQFTQEPAGSCKEPAKTLPRTCQEPAKTLPRP